MKLDSVQLEAVERRLGIRSLPNAHPLSAELEQAFGPHTFFLDSNGLCIVEADPPPATSGRLVKLANWALLGQEPEKLPGTFDLAPDAIDQANNVATGNVVTFPYRMPRFTEPEVTLLFGLADNSVDSGRWCGFERHFEPGGESGAKPHDSILFYGPDNWVELTIAKLPGGHWIAYDEDGKTLSQGPNLDAVVWLI